MNEKKVEKTTPHRIDHLANERTYLAWIRTSLKKERTEIAIEEKEQKIV